MTLTQRQKIGFFIGLPVLLLASAAFYLVHSLDAAKIVEMTAHEVKSATGRDLQVRGPVGLRFFPRIAVTAEQVSLSNAPWAVDPDMVRADRVSISLRWAPLFHKRIEVDDIRLDRAVIALQAAPNGQGVSGNWALNDVPSTSVATTSDTAFAFDVNQIHLNQVQVNYRDQTQVVRQSLMINRLNITATGDQSVYDGTFALNTVPIGLQGKTTSLTHLMAAAGSDAVPLALDLNVVLAGQPTKVQGTLNFAASGPPSVNLKIDSPALDLRPLTAAMSTQMSANDKGMAALPSRSSPSSRSQRVFSDTPIGFDLMPAWRGAVSLDIGSLTLPDGLALQQLKTTLVAEAADKETWTLSPLSFQLGEGRVTATVALSGLHTAQPVIRGRGYATGFTLGHLMAQLGEGKQLSGGPTVAAFHLSSQGTTPHAIAANLSGEAQVSVGQAVVSSALFNNSGDFLISVLNAVNPLRKSVDQTNLQCMEAYLPIQKGLIRINQSIGLRSDRLDVVLDGRVDLGSERLALNIYPQQRSGLTTGVNPAGLVQINGTLMNPSMGINTSGVVKQAAGVGLAIVTGGVSLIAQNAASVVTRSNPCDKVQRPWSQVTGGLVANH